jgi:hypothetical protein
MDVELSPVTPLPDKPQTYDRDKLVTRPSRIDWAVLTDQCLKSRLMHILKETGGRRVAYVGCGLPDLQSLNCGTQVLHGRYDGYCFRPLYVSSGSRWLVAYLRHAAGDPACHTAAILRLLVRRASETAVTNCDKPA